MPTVGSFQFLAFLFFIYRSPIIVHRFGFFSSLPISPHSSYNHLQSNRSSRKRSERISSSSRTDARSSSSSYANHSGTRTQIGHVYRRESKVKPHAALPPPRTLYCEFPAGDLETVNRNTPPPYHHHDRVALPSNSLMRSCCTRRRRKS